EPPTDTTVAISWLWSHTYIIGWSRQSGFPYLLEDFIGGGLLLDGEAWHVGAPAVFAGHVVEHSDDPAVSRFADDGAAWTFVENLGGIADDSELHLDIVGGNRESV